MHLRHLFSPRLRGSLLLGSLLVASSFSTLAAEDMLRKAVGKGAYEMAWSQQENALWLATSQSRKLDKGGVVYRLDPVTLEITQAIHNDLSRSAPPSMPRPKRCGLAIPLTALLLRLMPKRVM